MDSENVLLSSNSNTDSVSGGEKTFFQIETKHNNDNNDNNNKNNNSFYSTSLNDQNQGSSTPIRKSNSTPPTAKYKINNSNNNINNNIAFTTHIGIFLNLDLIFIIVFLCNTIYPMFNLIIVKIKLRKKNNESIEIKK
jgi:hypothetical protein